MKVHDEKHLTVGFPQRVVTWEELLDRLQVKLWVYPDRLEVRGIVPIEDIANPKCCYQYIVFPLSLYSICYTHPG